MIAASTHANLVLLAVLTPFVGALIIPFFRNFPNLRELVTLLTASGLCLTAFLLLGPVLDGSRPEVQVINIAPGLTLAFRLEPLGMLFALVASVLWIANSIYSIGYMRANNEPRQTGFYVCFALALGSTIALAFAKNLFTLFLFYEALTLSTFPLVTHKANAEAIHAGRIYLLLLLGTSLVLFLPAIIITWIIAGTIDFIPGGILADKISPSMAAALLALYAFGIGKAALMPLHFWLPAAMVAPTPVSALLHAVAVVKAGVFTLLKVILYVFGLDTLVITGANNWLVFVASASLILASLIAITRDDLKARLAYSTVGQLAYVVLGAAIATSNTVIGSGFQIAAHAAAKITLFFCAGAIYTAHRLTVVSKMSGIGRKMPVTMLAFFIASLSIIGLPPLGGTWSKWMLMLGAFDAGQSVAAAVLMLSSILSVGYLMPIVVRGYFLPADIETGTKISIEEAPVACLVALCCTAILTIALFFQAGHIETLLEGIFSAQRET